MIHVVVTTTYQIGSTGRELESPLMGSLGYGIVCGMAVGHMAINHFASPPVVCPFRTQTDLVIARDMRILQIPSACCEARHEDAQRVCPGRGVGRPFPSHLGSSLERGEEYLGWPP